MIQALGFWWTCASERVRKPKAPSQRVAVDVFVPVYKEPVDIVDLTVAAAAGLRGAEVRVWVLDDGNDDDMRDLAARYGVGYIRREEHTGAKAGNINNALTLTDAPFIAVFDSDHVADPAFLEATLGHMEDPVDRVRADAAVLRQRRSEPRRGGVVVAAGALLRRDRARQGRPRHRSSAAAPTCCSGARPSRAWAASRRTRSPRTTSCRSGCTSAAGRRPTCRTCCRAASGPRTWPPTSPSSSAGRADACRGCRGRPGRSSRSSSRRSTCCRRPTSCPAGRC